MKNNKFQIGDKVRWYSDQEGELTGVIVDSHKAGPVDKPRISYDIKIKNKTYKVIETALDRIPMTDLTVQKHGGITAHTSLESSELFNILTAATNYASDKMEEAKKRGQLLMDNIRFTSDWESKMAQVKQSYDYWNTEYEKLHKLNNDLRA